jgi:hypothetical protein
MELAGLVSETVKKLSCLEGLEHLPPDASIRVGDVENLLITT